MDKTKENLMPHLIEMADIYGRVKRLILLVEYYNDKNGIVLAPINELRNAFDHVMRSVSSRTEEQTEYEFSCARKHLYRAAYDACEVIILNRMEYIESMKRIVTYDVLDKICNNYTTEVLPFLSKAKNEIVEIRQDTNTEERIDKYEELITTIIDYSEQV